MVRHLTARCQYGKFINAKYRREKLIKKINTPSMYKYYNNNNNNIIIYILQVTALHDRQPRW